MKRKKGKKEKKKEKKKIRTTRTCVADSGHVSLSASHTTSIHDGVWRLKRGVAYQLRALSSKREG